MRLWSRNERRRTTSASPGNSARRHDSTALIARADQVDHAHGVEDGPVVAAELGRLVHDPFVTEFHGLERPDKAQRSPRPWLMQDRDPRADHTLLHQRQRLVDHAACKRLTANPTTGLRISTAPDRGRSELTRACNLVRSSSAVDHHFDQRNQVRRAQRMRNEAVFATTDVRQELFRRNRRAGTREMTSGPVGGPSSSNPGVWFRYLVHVSSTCSARRPPRHGRAEAYRRSRVWAESIIPSCSSSCRLRARQRRQAPAPARFHRRPARRNRVRKQNGPTAADQPDIRAPAADGLTQRPATRGAQPPR